MVIESTKKWIDEASYQELLAKWRFAPIGDPMFQGELGEYFQTVMSRRREELRLRGEKSTNGSTATKGKKATALYFIQKAAPSSRPAAT